MSVGIILSLVLAAAVIVYCAVIMVLEAPRRKFFRKRKIK